MRVIQFSGNLQSPLNIPEPPSNFIHSRGRSHRPSSSDQTSQPFASSPRSIKIRNASEDSTVLQKLWSLFSPIWQQIKNHLPKFLASPQPKSIIRTTQQEIPLNWVFFPQLPDVPEEREFSKSPQKKADFPVLGSRSIPIKGDYKKEAELILPDGKTGWLAFQYGNLNEHGAFWLEDIHGNTLGLLSRERSKQTFGDVSPRSFYPISIKLLHPELPETLQNSIQNCLIRQAVQQAKSNYTRFIIEPQNRDEAHLLRKHGFVNLQKSLNHYVPAGENNHSSKRTSDLLAFDGFLDGYGANFFKRNAVNSAIHRN